MVIYFVDYLYIWQKDKGNLVFEESKWFNLGVLKGIYILID